LLGGITVLQRARDARRRAPFPSMKHPAVARLPTDFNRRSVVLDSWAVNTLAADGFAVTSAAPAGSKAVWKR